MSSNQNNSDINSDEKLLDHNYDGIQELDNPLPAWWVYLFYITIVFAFIYMIIFSFFVPSTGALADQQMEKLTTKPVQTAAPASEAETETSSASAPAELSFPNDEDTLETGKKVFDSKCLACHGTKGEGLVGPNMTDDYWIHGKGTEADMYKVVVEGVPDKGMISWQPLLSDEEIKAVVVYIKTLRGTNPPNPKAPQGEKVG